MSRFVTKRKLSPVLALLLSLLGSFLQAHPAFATTIVVTNTNDGGAGSLRQAC